MRNFENKRCVECGEVLGFTFRDLNGEVWAPWRYCGSMLLRAELWLWRCNNSKCSNYIIQGGDARAIDAACELTLRKGPKFLWLDDLRPMPAEYNVHIMHDEACIKFLKEYPVSVISFDNDLGDKTPGTEGRDVATWIEEAAFSGVIERIEWRIHSANPVGRSAIEAAMAKADQFWSQNEAKEQL